MLMVVANPCKFLGLTGITLDKSGKKQPSLPNHSVTVVLNISDKGLGVMIIKNCILKHSTEKHAPSKTVF